MKISMKNSKNVYHQDNPSKFNTLLSEDEDAQDINRELEIDDIDRIDVENSMLYHNETGDNFHDIGHNKHLLT